MEAKDLFRDFALGLDYCIVIFRLYYLVHNFVNVVHRDIKPENLLVNNKN